MAIGILDAFSNEPPALDFVWPGLLAGTVGGMASPGAAGKTFLAIEAAMAVAGGPAADLIGLAPASTGRVVYLSLEDPEVVLQHRLHQIGKHLPAPARDRIAENLVLESLVGGGLDVMKEKHADWLVEICAGARLVVLDTLSRIHKLDENSNGEMAQLITALEHLSVVTGAAILFLHHTSKNSASNGQLDQQQAARGASALVDNARWGGFVAKMSGDESKKLSDREIDRRPIGDRRGYFVRFGVSKQNYGLPQEDKWLRRSTGGVLLPADLLPAHSKPQAVKKGAGDDWE
ncbi:MAG: helicase RepA family protein [Sulfuricella sp.]